MTGRRTPRRARFVFAALLGAVAVAAHAHAADDGEPAPKQQGVKQDSATTALRIGSLRAGLGGRFKVGYWTPFEVELEGGGSDEQGRLVLITPDGDGVPARVATPLTGELTIAAGERKTVELYAKIGQLGGEVTIDFRTPEGRRAMRRYGVQTEGPLAGALPSTAMLAVVVGAEPGGEQSSGRAPSGVQLAHVDDVEQLPSEWWGYAGVDALVVTTSDAAIRSQLAAGGPRLAELEMWVRMGGKLIVSLGPGAEELLAADSPLAKLVPGQLEAMVPLRQSTITMLETYAEATASPISDVPPDSAVPKLADVRGKVEAFDGRGPRDLPLVVRAPHGFGEVVFVAFDLDRPPVAGWAGRKRLLEKLLGSRRVEADDDSGTLGEVTTLGFTDLAGQLRGALDQFEGVQLVPFWLVAGLITLYIACIGPLDYYLVKYSLRRMEATWLTFAVTVVLFSVAAVVLAYRFKGRDVRVNQVDLVDFDAESGLMRGTTWLNVYSPRTATYDLSLRPAGVAAGAADAGMLFSWFGLTGTGFGGMDIPGRLGGDAATLGLAAFDRAYDYSAAGDAIEGVPIAVWSSKAFVGQWWGQSNSGVEATLADDGRLRGTLESKLDVPLERAVLLYGKWAYVIRTFEPGQVIDLEAIDPQTADTYLRQVTVRGDRQVAAPFDQASFDVPRIVEMISAQGLAEGEYTGLTNRYESTSEMTNLVQDGRAVLLGRVEPPATVLENAGQPLGTEHTHNWTFYRYVFSVAPEVP